MKPINFILISFTLLTMLTGCDAAANIFKAGLAVYIIGGILVLALVIFIVNKLFGKK